MRIVDHGDPAVFSRPRPGHEIVPAGVIFPGRVRRGRNGEILESGDAGVDRLLFDHRVRGKKKSQLPGRDSQAFGFRTGGRGGLAPHRGIHRAEPEENIGEVVAVYRVTGSGGYDSDKLA